MALLIRTGAGEVELWFQTAIRLARFLTETDRRQLATTVAWAAAHGEALEPTFEERVDLIHAAGGALADPGDLDDDVLGQLELLHDCLLDALGL